MAQILGSTMIAAFIAFAAYICMKISKRVSYYKLERTYGCLEPPSYPHMDPWGFDLYFAQKKAVLKGEGQLKRSKRFFVTYGKTFQMKVLGQRVIRTMEPANIQAVLALNFKQFGLQPLREGTAKPFFDRGINTTDGEFWHYSRSLIRPTFARVEICNLTSLEKHVSELIEGLPTDGSTVELQALISRILRTSTEFLFGESTNLHSSVSIDNFNQSFNMVLVGIAKRLRAGKFRFLHRDDESWFEAIRIVHEYVDFFIDKAIERQSNQSLVEKTREPERYVLLHEMAKQTQDKLDLRSQILTVFMPGKDTATTLVGNVFHMLARRPDVWDKLRAEVLSMGEKNLTFEVLKSMRYLQAILNETHRVYPVSPYVPRVCLEDSVLPTGGGRDGKSPILVKKGDHIHLDTYNLGQDKDIWGENAEDFEPDRWKKVKPVWTFLPFSGGPRICPAQQLVNTEAAYIVARLVQSFPRIENRDPNPWTEGWRLGPISKYGVKIALMLA